MKKAEASQLHQIPCPTHLQAKVRRKSGQDTHNIPNRLWQQGCLHLGMAKMYIERFERVADGRQTTTKQGRTIWEHIQEIQQDPNTIRLDHCLGICGGGLVPFLYGKEGGQGCFDGSSHLVLAGRCYGNVLECGCKVGDEAVDFFSPEE
jgi:hypothetical protein